VNPDEPTDDIATTVRRCGLAGRLAGPHLRIEALKSAMAAADEFGPLVTELRDLEAERAKCAEEFAAASPQQPVATNQ